MTLLKRLFGPDIKEIWQKLCQEIGGDFVEGGAMERRQDRSQTPPLDHYARFIPRPYRKSAHSLHAASCRLRESRSFRFRVTRRGLFSGIGKLLGMQDVEVAMPTSIATSLSKATAKKS